MSVENVADKAKQALQKQGNGNGKQNNLPATMADMKTNQVSQLINLYKGQIAQALPKHLTAERMIQIATTLISRNPQLSECTIPSLMGAVIQASMFGFEPIPQLGYCYLIPYKNSKVRDNQGNAVKEAQFMIGYKGLIQLAMRSDEVQTINAHVVYENDTFEFEFGLDDKLVHKPATTERGKPICVYAIVKYKNGGYAFEVMNEIDVEKHRKRSQSQQLWDAANKRLYPSPKPVGIWETDGDAMWKKTAIIQVLKYAPMSIEFQKSIMTDGAVLNADDFEDGVPKLENVENADATVINESESVNTSTGEITKENKPEFDESDPSIKENPKYWLHKINSFQGTPKEWNIWKKENKNNFEQFSGKDDSEIKEAIKVKEEALLK